MDLPDHVHLNPDAGYVEKLRAVMAKNGGYCLCRLQRTPENLCMCGEFRGQLADPDFSDYCHCKLYYKD